MNLSADLKARLSAYWILVAHQTDEDGKIIPYSARHVGEFPNLITNTGLDMIGVGLGVTFVQVGSGSTTPANTDTTLQTRLAGTNNLIAQAGTYNVGPPEYGQYTRTWRFTAGQAAGNLSEIGVSGGSTTPLFSRALILDGVGSPTTITILPSEVLDCTYVMRIQPPAADVTGSSNVTAGNTPTTYNWTIRPATVGSWQNFLSAFGGISSPTVNGYDGAIGARAAQPSGNSSAGTAAWNAYSNGSKTRQLVGSFDLTHGNFANGITAFFMSSVGVWQMGINSGANIPKTANDVLAVTFNFSWDRA